MFNYLSINSNFKSYIVFIAVIYVCQFADKTESIDSPYGLPGPYNDVPVEYGGYYPNNQGGYPIQNNFNIPVAQTPIFQSNFGTKGGGGVAKGRPEYGKDNHWWNWKNVIQSKPLIQPAVNVPPIYTSQKTNQVQIDNDRYGYNYDSASYNQPIEPIVNQQYQSGKMIQSPAVAIKDPRLVNNVVAPLSQPIVSQGFNSPTIIKKVFHRQNRKKYSSLFNQPMYSAKGNSLYSAPDYRITTLESNPVAAYGVDYSTRRPRFLGFGSIQHIGPEPNRLRILCRFDEALSGLTNDNTVVNNVKWAKFVGSYNPWKIEPSYDCQGQDCQLGDISETDRFSFGKTSDLIHTLTIDNVQPEDYGSYRCSAMKFGPYGYVEQVYQVIALER